MINADQLAAFQLFSDLSSADLSAIAGECDLLEYSNNDVIFKYGETATAIYGVLEGEVALSLVFEDKVLKADIDYEEALQKRFEVFEKPIVVETVSPGEIFGWSALVQPHTSTATATCRAPVQVCAISGETLRRRFAENTALGFAIMNRLSELVSQRLRTRTRKLIETWGAAFGADQV